ncbi:hypothetical protein OH77DRAFT_66354 [Trametes cingulata]|nr:hypothetical protein OH77DRAFT_66354 [Trametes cingulata]
MASSHGVGQISFRPRRDVLLPVAQNKFIPQAAAGGCHSSIDIYLICCKNILQPFRTAAPSQTSGSVHFVAPDVFPSSAAALLSRRAAGTNEHSQWHNLTLSRAVCRHTCEERVQLAAGKAAAEMEDSSCSDPALLPAGLRLMYGLPKLRCLTYIMRLRSYVQE